MSKPPPASASASGRRPQPSGKQSNKKVVFFDDDDGDDEEAKDGGGTQGVGKGGAKVNAANSKAKPKKSDLIKEILNVGAAVLGLTGGKYKPEIAYPYTRGNERLDEDFNEVGLQWEPPDVDVALTTNQKRMWRNGELPYVNLLGATMIHEPDIALGTQLHFYFVKSAAVCLFVMSVLCVPSLVLTMHGTHVPAVARDPMGLYVFTVGNIGLDESSRTFRNDSSCGHTVSSFGSTYHGTCVRALGLTLTSPEAAGLLTLFEVLQVLAFFCFVLHFRRRVMEMVAERRAKDAASSVKPSDYTVVVRGVPHGTTEEELVDFFSQLYPLDVPDWKQRPAVADARPVESTDHHGVPFYKGTWVAECSIYYSKAHFLQFYKEQHRFMKRLFRHRARMKMFDEKTPHANGPRARYWRWAERAMIREAARLDRMTEDFLAAHTKEKKVVQAATKPKGGKKNAFFGKLFKPKAATVVVTAKPGAAAAVEKKVILGPDGKPARTIMVPDPEDPDNMIEIIDPAYLIELKGATDDLADAVLNRKATDLIPELTADVGVNKTNVVGSADAEHISKDDDPMSKFKPRKLVVAFVTFEYAESMARCVEDYRAASWRPASFYPPQLKFKGKFLHVEQAPDPEAIVWDNLEETPLAKLGQRLLTGAVIFVVVVISYAIMVQASSFKVSYEKSMPSKALCGVELPKLYNLGSYTDISLTYPPATNGFQAKLNQMCSKVSPGSVYAEWSYHGDFNEEGLGGDSNYNTAQCAVKPNGLCPNFVLNGTTSVVQGPSTYCPCVRVDDGGQECSTIGCMLPPLYNKDPACQRFKPSLVGKCLCQTRLSSSVAAGLSSIYAVLANPSEVCRPYYLGYLTSVGINYVIIVVLVVANLVLKWVIRIMVRWESHSSFGKMNTATLMKVFVGIFVNLAVIPIVAFGSVGTGSSVLQTLMIFQGEYDDFSKEWYGVVGSFLITEMMFYVIVFVLAQWGMAVVCRNLTRQIVTPLATQRYTYIWAMQDDLDRTLGTPYFNPAAQSGHLLAVMFFAMTFASGLPFIIPLACIGFLMSFVLDKWLYCRYYRRPNPLVDSSEEPMMAVISILPYAAFMRLAFACWMLSSRGVFVVGTAYGDVANLVAGGLPLGLAYSVYLYLAEAILRGVAGSDDKTPDWLLGRIFLPHIFPMFVLLVLFVVIKIAIKLVKLVLAPPISALVRAVMPLCQKKPPLLNAEGKLIPYELLQLHDPLRRQSSPFTGDFVRLLRPAADAEKPPEQPLCSCIPWPAAVMRNCCPGCRRVTREDLTDAEAEEGWVVEVQDAYLVKFQEWGEMTNLGGVVRLQGERRRTLEIIMSSASCTYMLNRMPAYRFTLQSTGDENLNGLMMDAAGSHASRLGTITAEDLFASVGNGGDPITDKYLFKKAGRTVKKNDTRWDVQLPTDDARRAKLTDKQKTDEAYDKFWVVGERPEEDPDDEEWDSDEWTSDSDEDGDYSYGDEGSDSGDEVRCGKGNAVEAPQPSMNALSTDTHPPCLFVKRHVGKTGFARRRQGLADKGGGR